MSALFYAGVICDFKRSVDVLKEEQTFLEISGRTACLHLSKNTLHTVQMGSDVTPYGS